MTTKLKPIDILLVEDNPGDVRLTQEATQEAMHDAKVRNKLHVVNNGVEALAYLRHTGKYAQEQYPDLILLDLNLPQMGGGEVLEKIKEDEKLRRIPVVVLTTSQAEQDILRSYNLHANAYVVKPVDLEQFIAVVKSIESFWLEIVRLPSDGDG
jgi:two-component system, chemotaxis family, response regulator Rcp1